MKCGICQPGTTTRICDRCLDAHPPMTHDGRVISFRCTSHTGAGFESVVDGKRTCPPMHYCYVNDVKCYASEAYMGGIEIEISMEADGAARK